MSAEGAESRIQEYVRRAGDVTSEDPRAALELVRRALDEASALDPARDDLLASSHWHVAATLFRLGELDDAATHASSSRAHYEAAEDVAGRARASSLEGAIARRRGDFEQAYAAQSVAAELAEQAGDHAVLAGARNNMGIVAQHLGRLDEAMQAYLQAEQLFLGDASGSERGSLVFIWNNIAILHVEQGLVEEAIPYFRRSIAHAEARGTPSMAVNALFNFGRALKKRGELDEAFEVLTRAHDLGVSSGASREAALALRALAMIHEEMGEADEAVARVREALEIVTRSGEEIARVQCMIELGGLLSRSGQLEEAEALFGDALEFSRRRASLERECQVRRELVLHHERTGRLQEALDELRAVRELEGRIHDAERAAQVEELRARHAAAQREREAELLRRHNAELAGQVAERTEALERANALLTDAHGRAEAANAAKNAFFAMMGHELRTPLNIIVGYTEMAVESLGEEDELEPEMVRADLERVLAASSGLTEIIDRMLTLAHLSSSGLEVSPGAVALSELVREHVARAATRFAGSGNAFVFEDELPTGLRAHTDASKLGQALDALLENAAEFTDGGVIEVSAHALEEGGSEWIVLRVKDEGPGVDPEEAQRIFEPFEQGEVTAIRVREGVGLGLALVRHHVSLLGGRVGVERARDGESGATFFITIPRELAALSA